MVPLQYADRLQIRTKSNMSTVIGNIRLWRIVPKDEFVKVVEYMAGLYSLKYMIGVSGLEEHGNVADVIKRKHKH